MNDSSSIRELICINFRFKCIFNQLFEGEKKTLRTQHFITNLHLSIVESICTNLFSNYVECNNNTRKSKKKGSPTLRIL